MFCEISPRRNNLSPQTGNVGRTPRIGLSYILRLHPRTRQMDSDLNGRTKNILNFIIVNRWDMSIHPRKYKKPPLFTEAKEL